ncbi:MAG: helix-turn-helix transcriptional regulator [Nitrospinota bacterium]
MSPREKEYFTISVVSEMYELHPQTLRLYEREGLLKPSRSKGNTRLYSREDVERLEMILNLTRELGVNIAGVSIILELREKLARNMALIEELKNLLGSEIWETLKARQEGPKNALVRARSTKVVKIKEADNR